MARGFLAAAKLPPAPQRTGGRHGGVHAACALLLAFALSGCGSKSSPDAVPPVVSLNGAALIVLSLHEDFSDPGATATDDRDGAVAVRVSGSVDSDRAGEYTLTYSAADAAGNSASAARTVRVVDDIPPVVTLNGEAEMSISYRDAFADPGATATDDPDGALPVTVTGTVESGRIGEYALTYSATDAAGNSAEATRTVRVVDDVPPAITLDGPAVVELERDEPYWDPGATAEDEIDGAVETTARGEVGEAAGEYALVYRAVDAAGNAAEATRTVTRAPGDYMLEVDVFGEGEVRLAAGEATTPFRCEDGACFGRFREGERVELEATAGPGRRFDGWGTGVCDEIADGRCALAMDRNRLALPAFVSEEPLTMHDDVVALTPEQIEGLLFWAPHAGVAAFDEWTDLRDLAPGSVMVSYGVPDEDGFPTEPAFLARVLSVRETQDGSQLVATAPAGLDDLYASGTLVARGEFTRSALERARLAPGVKLVPAPEGAEGAPKLSVPDIGPLTDGIVTLSGEWEVIDEGDDFRAVLNVTATAAFTIVPTIGPDVWSQSIPLTSVDVPVPAFPFIIMSVAPVVVPAVEFKGGVSAKVKGEATLWVGGSLDRSTNDIGAVFDPDVKITRFVFDEAAGGAKPKLDLQLGLLARGEVSVFKVVGVRMNVTPYYGVKIEPGDCELETDPYWGVDASVTAFLNRPWPWLDLEWTLYHDEYGPIDLSSFTPCVDTTEPTRPSGLTATRAGRDVELRWSASSDNSGVVTAYRVYRGSGRIGTTGRTSYVDRNPGTGTHRYRVKAEDAAGNRSPYSLYAHATVPPNDPPPQSRPAKPAIEIREETSGSTRSYWLSWSPEEADVEYWILARGGGNWHQTVQVTSSPRQVVPYGSGPQSCYRIRATNSAGSTDSDSRCFTPQGNSPPTAYADDDFRVVARGRGTLRGRGADADGRVTSYAWTQTGRPKVTLNGASSATATFTAPAVTTRTTLTFLLTVTDDAGATGTDDVRATVLPAATTANRKPRAKAGDNQDVTTGEMVTLSGEDSYDDHGIVAWRWEQWDRGPDVSLFGANSENATFVAPPVSKERTKLRFDLTVTDGHGETDIDRVNVYVSPQNRPPAADAGRDQSVASGAAVTLSGSGSDPDGDALSYVWRQTDDGPTVTLNGASSATATFTAPTVSARTTLEFQLTVTDNAGATASDTVDVTVSPPAANRPPAAYAGRDQSVASGAAVTLNGSGSDPDGDALSYAWRQTDDGPTVTLNGPSSATATFTAPTVSARTTLEFQLTVTDNAGATASDTVDVTVSPPAANLPPVASAGANQSVASGAAVTLNGSGSDPDGDALSYAWRQTDDGPTVTLNGASSATATFTAPTVSARTTLEFQLTVTDNVGATGADEATVTVAPAATGNTPVNIPDANLRTKLLAALGKSAGDTITRSDMVSLTSFTASCNNIPCQSAITNLTGLGFATSLTYLSLFGNSISDISALSGLTSLRTLNLFGNSISDISALSGLTSLRTLQISSNPISDSDISALSGLTSLSSLSIDQSRSSISDISALSRLTSLTYLSLFGNSISDISALSRLTSLATLALSSNSISDISALSGLTSLTYLSLGRNSTLSDISAVQELTSLTTLILSYSSISDISALSGLTSLTYLSLDQNSISDAEPLVDNTGLGSGDIIQLRRNPLSAQSINTRVPALRARGATVYCSLVDGTAC